MTVKQKRFVEEYLIDFNGAAAARRAGYSESTARQTAYGLLQENEEVKAAIQKALDEQAMSKGEAMRRLTDIAQTRLNDYFIVRQVKQVTKVEKPLAEVIATLETKVVFEDKYAAAAELSENEQKAHESAQTQRRREIIRLQLELQENPDATRMVDGPTEIVEEVVLDLPKLVKDKRNGLIKTFKYNEFGPVVEGYPVDAALDKILHIHGAYKTKIDLSTLSDEQADALLDKAIAKLN
ncbi:terminase small subunit [Arsenicibacter rosenii]|uniref:Terminase small subunit n=1 Tax=Arsenicibacter rosenii TaxID=1750698 RepID=A0A1S2VK14_9BACT|nr:terminase small subunit [Arsenicibacter rosenii]OIN59099.1 hypothetical protein BLX24_12910 [Arsenicibacter rosenii]